MGDALGDALGDGVPPLNLCDRFLFNVRFFFFNERFLYIFFFVYINIESYNNLQGEKVQTASNGSKSLAVSFAGPSLKIACFCPLYNL